MVKSVYGVCEGFNIIFTRRGDTDLWDVDVPFERDGSYVVSLYAMDYAGNESYYATVLFTVKRFCISVKVLDINVNARMVLDLQRIDGESFCCPSQNGQTYYMAVDWERLYRLNPSITYAMKPVRCERCGGV